jgi:hypothetical protein
MSITVKHKFVSAIPDAGDTTIVQPSNWNDDHQLSGTVPPTNGGTGASTLTGYVKGNGTSTMTANATIPNTDITGLGTASTKDAGVANGVATLDGSGTVPISQLPAAVIGALSYQGTWNASTNTPTLTSSVGTKGYYYVVNVAGSTNLNGITDWQVGDWAVYNGSAWQKIDNTDAVTSVNGYTGTVVLNATDVGAVSSVSGTAPVSVATGTTTPVVSLATAYGDTQNPYASKTANYVLASPNGSAGVPTFRALVAADLPSLSGSYIPYTGASSAIDLNAQTVTNIAHLGINTTTVPTILMRAFGDNNSGSRIAVRGYSSNTSSSSMRVTKFRGTYAAPQAPQSGDSLGKFELAGYGTTSSDGYPQASYEGVATEAWGATARGTKALFKVTPNTTTTQVTALTIDQDSTATFASTVTANGVLLTGNLGTVTSVTGTSPVVSSGGTTPAISMPVATSSVNGYLSSTDWNTFNGKGNGTVTAVSVTSANGFAGTSSGGATPALTLTTSVTGVLKGNGTAISAATAGTDYSLGTSALGTGILKSTTATGALTIAVSADFPTLNQNTTGTASNVTGTVAIANGGSGQTTAQTAMNAFAGAVTSGSYLRGNGTNVVMNTIQAADVPTLNQNTTGTASNVTGTVAIANGGTGSTTGYGLAKAWVNFNGTTGAINGTAFNVSSVTRNASGNYSINFTTAMPNANYAGSFCGNGLAQIPVFYSPTTGYLQVLYYDTAGTPVSPTICVATIFST